MQEGMPPAQGAPVDPTAAAAAVPQDQQPVQQPVEATPPANGLAGRKTPWDSRAFTQATQVASAVKRELGLPDSATQDEVTQAIAQLRQGGGDDYLASLDPQTQQHIIGLEERIWAKNRSLYGETEVDQARNLYDMARQTNDPDAFIEAFYNAVQAVTSPADASGSTPQEQAAAAQGQPAPQMPDLAAGDVPLAPQPTNTPSPAAGSYQGTGNIAGWLRSLRSPGG